MIITGIFMWIAYYIVVSIWRYIAALPILVERSYKPDIRDNSFLEVPERN